MWGCHTPTLFYATPPPLSLWRKTSGSKWHEKHPKFAPSNRLRKPGCPVGRIAVVSDIFIRIKVCFCFTKTLARGVPPGPLRVGKGKTMARPRLGESERRRRTIGRAGGGGRGGRAAGASPSGAALGGSLPAPPGAGSAGAERGGAAAGGGGATGAEPDRGAMLSNAIK